MVERVFIKIEQGFELLARLCDEPALSDKLQDETLDAFEDMRGQKGLSHKQLQWVQSTAVNLGVLEQPTTNEWSSRTPEEQKRIRGRDVPTPAVLLNLPMRPPHRLKELASKKVEE